MTANDERPPPTCPVRAGADRTAQRFDPRPLIDDCGGDATDRFIAERCGVSIRTVQRWRHGGLVRWELADRIAGSRLGVHPAHLWPDDWYR